MAKIYCQEVNMEIREAIVKLKSRTIRDFMFNDLDDGSITIYFEDSSSLVIRPKSDVELDIEVEYKKIVRGSL